MIDFHWKNEAKRWRSEICLIRSYADSLLNFARKYFLDMNCLTRLNVVPKKTQPKNKQQQQQQA